MPNDRPHIIMIMTDQQRTDTVRAWGNPHMHTPALDDLASRSTSFTCAYAPGATCVASRAAIFTGMFAQQTGVYSFMKWGHQPNWVRDLANAGYYCASIGKMHFMPIYSEGGFHERIVVENPADRPYVNEREDDDWGYYLKAHGATRPLDRHKTDPEWASKHASYCWDMDEHLYSEVFIGSKAKEWIRNHPASDRPTFLQIGFTAPHEPYDPLERHFDLYRDAEVPAPVFAENEFDEKPPQHRAHGKSFDPLFHLEKASAEDVIRMRRHYYAKVTTLDEQIGLVMDELRSQGYLENSLVIFCSDHADMLGDHRLPCKFLMYDTSIRVPLMIWDTRRKEQRPQVTQPVSLIDLGPTVLNAAGLNAPTYHQGRSLLDDLDAAKPLETAKYVFCSDNYQTMIRDSRFKLVHYLHQSAGELYDLDADPHELKNLWSDPAYETVKHELKEAMLEWALDGSYRHAGFKVAGAREYELRDARRSPALFFTPSLKILAE